LSFRAARRHFTETALVTDSRGKMLLVDELGLEFTHVGTELDCLGHDDPSLWALGKLTAYSLQEEPFVHIDADVFLWRPLPPHLLGAPVLAQNPERFYVGDNDRDPRIVEAAFAGQGIDLPPEWEWARSHWGRDIHEANCGIVGGADVRFMSYYSALALDLVLNPVHAGAWAAVTDKASLNTIIEQFVLSACVEFHRSNPASSLSGVQLRYLFPSFESAYDRGYARRFGFTHLLGDAKSHPLVAGRLERRVAQEDRELYARCVTLGGSI
jgi:hypothetical protein